MEQIGYAAVNYFNDYIQNVMKEYVGCRVDRPRSNKIEVKMIDLLTNASDDIKSWWSIFLISGQRSSIIESYNIQFVGDGKNRKVAFELATEKATIRNYKDSGSGSQFNSILYLYNSFFWTNKRFSCETIR